MRHKVWRGMSLRTCPIGSNDDCTFSIPVTLGFGDFHRSTGLPQRPTGPVLARTFRISDSRGRTPAFMRRRSRWVSRCSVHAPLSKAPQPRTDANGVAVPERKIGFEALEASAKLRKKQHGLFERSEFRGCPKRAANPDPNLVWLIAHRKLTSRTPK